MLLSKQQNLTLLSTNTHFDTMLCEMTFKLADLSCMCVFEEAQTEDSDIVVMLTSNTDSYCGYSKNMYTVISDLENLFHDKNKHISGNRSLKRKKQIKIILQEFHVTLLHLENVLNYHCIC